MASLLHITPCINLVYTYIPEVVPVLSIIISKSRLLFPRPPFSAPLLSRIPLRPALHRVPWLANVPIRRASVEWTTQLSSLLALPLRRLGCALRVGLGGIKRRRMAGNFVIGSGFRLLAAFRVQSGPVGQAFSVLLMMLGDRVECSVGARGGIYWNIIDSPENQASLVAATG